MFQERSFGPPKGMPIEISGRRSARLYQKIILDQRRHASEEPDPPPADDLEDAAGRQAHDGKHDANREAENHGRNSQEQRSCRARQDGRAEHVFGDDAPLHVLVGDEHLQEDDGQDGNDHAADPVPTFGTRWA